MTALYRTAPISVGNGNSAPEGIWGSLSSWEDTDGTRYVLAAVWGRAHATLYAFDGMTAEGMYSTGNQVSTAGNLTGLAIANGRLYFATIDNTINVFGKYLGAETEHNPRNR
jgi:hypothetical protein